MKPSMTVHEREQMYASLEREIIRVLKDGDKIELPELINLVAKNKRCARDDVAMALSRLSASVEQTPEGPTIMVRYVAIERKIFEVVDRYIGKGDVTLLSNLMVEVAREVDCTYGNVLATLARLKSLEAIPTGAIVKVLYCQDHEQQ